MGATGDDEAKIPARFADLILLPHLISVSRSIRQLLGIRLIELDVVVGQDQLLLAFDNDKTITVADLAHLLSIRASTVSKMVDRLVDKGWVARSLDSEDARRVLISLTDDGRAKRDAVLVMEAEVEAEVLADLAGLGPAAAQALVGLDTVLSRRLRRMR